MKFYEVCHECGLKQAMEAARITNCSSSQIEEIKRKVKILDQDAFKYKTAPAFHEKIYEIVKKVSKNYDPYKEIKKRDIKLALSLYERMEKIMENSENSLEAAIKLSVVGNLLDSAIIKDADLEKLLEKEFNSNCPIWDFKDFEKDVKRAKTVLFIADNAGETVFDLFLLKALQGKKIYYSVRSNPIINDAVIQDAQDSGIEKYAQIIESGSNAPGTIINKCSKEFLDFYNNVDLIISKGQGNLETLTEENKDIYFLLKAKCQVIADYLNTQLGGILLYHQKEK